MYLFCSFVGGNICRSIANYIRHIVTFFYKVDIKQMIGGYIATRNSDILELCSENMT